jgi:hypothetical protein
MTISKMRFEERVEISTGASSPRGIGCSIPLGLTTKDVELIVMDMNSKRVEAFKTGRFMRKVR